MVITVEIYREIRRRRLEGESQRGIARALHISRNTVKKYWEGERLPGERVERPREASVMTPEVTAFIAACLKSDEESPSKQRHTAKRIYDRLVEETGFTGGETTVRAYVRQAREKTREAFVPLAFAPGEAMQIDWGEATGWVDGVKQVLNLFCARLCHSGAPFVIAYRRQNSESFQDGLIHAFEYFGGTPKRVIFDNAKVAVKDGFGANAKATNSYALLAAHYGFEPVFCNIASGNEKGLVENLVGLCRRNFCVPVPRVESMDELNAMLLEGCERYLTHQIRGKEADVGTMFNLDQEALYPLPSYRYDPAKRAEAKVSTVSTVRYDTNSYSVPVQFCGKTVSIKALPERIEIFSAGEIIAVHPRCFDRQQSVYQLGHYLPLLERKGRAIFQARPVLDNVPVEFLNWLKRQNLKPRELVSLLKLSLEVGYEAVMCGFAPAVPPSQINDVIQVNEVDLAAYDALCGTGKGVSV